MTEKLQCDVTIIGAGAAGLSAATTLSRSMRSVVVVDAGAPRNAASDGAHNLLGQEGISPRELLARGRAEASSYGARFVDDSAVGAEPAENGFVIRTGGDLLINSRVLVLATGLTDVLPEVPGLADRWGKTVLHCPYCHGWEVRGSSIGILATSPNSVHQALLFRQLSTDITFFESPDVPLDENARQDLEARGIRIVRGQVVRINGDLPGITSITLHDGTDYPIDALVVAPQFVANTALYEQLGGTLEPHPMGMRIPVAEGGQTPLPGVWSAGNATDLAAMVAVSMGAGLTVGARINASLVHEGYYSNETPDKLA